MIPVLKDSKRTFKTSKEYTEKQVRSIEEIINRNMGQHAVLCIKDGRNNTPYYIRVTRKSGLHRYEGVQTCYSPTGGVRGKIIKTIDVYSLISGSQRLYFFSRI